MGRGVFKNAKKFPKPSMKTVLGINARYVKLIMDMFFTVLFNFGSLTFKGCLSYNNHFCLSSNHFLEDTALKRFILLIFAIMNLTLCNYINANNRPFFIEIIDNEFHKTLRCVFVRKGLLSNRNIQSMCRFSSE